jgi:hypothetical protein
MTLNQFIPLFNQWESMTCTDRGTVIKHELNTGRLIIEGVNDEEVSDK